MRASFGVVVFVAFAVACGGSKSRTPSIDAVGEVTPDLEAEAMLDAAVDPAPDATVEDSPDAMPDAPVEAGPELYDPGYQPVDPAQASQFQALLDDYVTFSGEANASLTAVLPGGARWSGVSGVMQVQTGEPVAPHAAFRVGSSTKPIMATLVLLLAEDGLLGLDDPLSRWVPDYPAWKDITVRQVLGMRSGIPDYLLSQAFWLAVIADPRKPLAPADLLKGVAGEPLNFAPGSQCEYSNSNYVLAGLVVEAATGKKAEDLIRDRIVVPLGLDHTYLDVAGDQDDRLAHGYMDPRPAFQALGVPAALVDVIPAEMFVSDHVLDCAYLFHPSVAWTAGGLVTTTDDMATFMRALVRGRLLKAESLVQMETFPACTILGSAAEYGLGLTRYSTPVGTAFGHGGLIYGYTANTMDSPDADLTCSDMHGAYPAQNGALLMEVFRVTRPGASAPPPACRPPDAFFASPDGDRMEIRFRGVLNADGAASPTGGIADVTEWQGTTRYPLYGTWSSAALKQATGGDRVDIGSLGPPRVDGAAVGQALLSVGANVLTGAASDGVVTLSAARPYDVVAAALDVYVDPKTNQANRLCVAAVPDLSRPAHMFVCDAGSVKAEVGEMVRFFGSIGLTSDDAKVLAYVKPLGLAKCNCPTAPNQWGPCPAGTTPPASPTPPARAFVPVPVPVTAPPFAMPRLLP